MPESRYSLLYEKDYYPLLRLPFEKFSILTVSLPFLAFLFCVAYSVLYNFESATYTHCQVVNLLPSISAAIGSFSPQRDVWQIAISLHAIPRFSVALVYLEYHQNVLYDHDFWLGVIACCLNLVENVALIVLSFYTSNLHYNLHKRAFVIFIITSELYMILICLLQNRYKKLHRKSLRWKKRFLFTNITCILVAMYFFMRHNSLCEPYIYTFFALCEYIVVLTNMAFHMTAYLDFKNKDLLVYKYGVTLTER